MITYTDAVDLINGAFRTAWEDGRALALLSYQPTVQYEGAINRTPQDWLKHFAVITQQTVIEKQSTLSCCVEDIGKKRFTTQGLVFVQLFSPLKNADGLDKCRKLAMIARSAFRGKHAGEVWFRNTRINKLPNDEACYRINVVSEFEYDEVN